MLGAAKLSPTYAAAKQMHSEMKQTFAGAARLSYRLLRREWRAGELRVLLAALVITVASITAVGLFIDRMEQQIAT